MPTLFDTISSGDLDALRVALEGGADANLLSEDEDESLLHRAAFCQNADAVRLLAQHGAQLDRICDGFTPLHLAVMEAEMDGPDAALALVELGASADHRSSTGYTALFFAGGLGLEPLIEALLDAGADVDVRTDQGWTALHEAATEDESGVGVRVLLTRGADADAITDTGITPAHRAAANAYVGSTMALLKRMSCPDAVDEDGYGVIHAASSGGLLEVVEWLIAKGVDARLATSAGMTPLHFAASYVGARDSSPDVVRALIDHGADPNAVDDAGRKPIDLAFSREEYESLF